MGRTLLFIASLFVFVSCGFVEPPPSERGDASYTNELENTSSEIKNTREFEECMQPSIKMCISQVGNQLAREQGSTKFCNEIGDEEAVNACKYGVIMSQIDASSDPDLCDDLSEMFRKECRIAIIMQSALASGELTRCEELRGELENKNSGEMPEGSVDRIEQCKLDTLMKQPEVTSDDCQEINNGPQKQMCLMIVKKRAEAQKNLN